MSVRSGVLAVLSLGPAYGLQLHAEIETRTARTGRINVGQIYSTLNRLVDARLVRPVEPDGGDHLPRYALTADGTSEVARWVVDSDAGDPDWAAMVEHVLLVASLPGVDPGILIDAYRATWSGRPPARETGTAERDAGAHRSAAAADQLLASAALAWLDGIETAVRRDELGSRPLSTERPRRGRRPSAIN
ncbi:PadR family transcriptional regulator [Subtercola boreus]|uniref:PadR family transcriptional regulator n=1 Tax=Subtercola boreus TaxID=120213 RepID=UPI00116FDA57|nr:PadR family transcriptional regulator [Subtercola boreus]TQL53454.1 PadR family transcriptional regulator [Subtercola boreus]